MLLLGLPLLLLLFLRRWLLRLELLVRLWVLL